MTAIDAAGAPLRSAPPPARQPTADPSYAHISPTMQAATSPSTVQASPLSTPHPGSFLNGSTNRVKSSDTPKQRARLACAHCRKSKIKCLAANEHDPTREPCKICAKSGKECVWPTAAASDTAAAKKSSASAGLDSPLVDRLPEPKKRKKVIPSEIKTETEGDFYNPHLFSEQVWKELYNIFKQHYVTELPFLHEASFLPMLKQTDIQCLPDSFAPLILALVSLTVPFHDELVHRLSQSGRLSAIQISRVYADAADHKIYETRALDHPSIRLVQALLMLSLRAHGDGQGSKSSIVLGNAISCMQLLGCHYEKDLDDKADKIKQSAAKPKPDPSTTTVEESFITDEIKRRTFWSCYIIDRYISSGDYKPRRIHIKEALVQLPCSHDAFLHGIYKTKTRMLRETDDQFNRRRKQYTQSHSEEEDVEWEDEDKQEPLVWFIKALDLYEDVMKWACTVTRRNEKDPPWKKTFIDRFDKFGGSIKKEERLSFANLDERLRNFTDKLPAKLKLTTPRTLAHIHGQTSTPFILLHSVLALCNIVLHREWLPFLPGPEARPTGPIDGPNCHQFKDRAHNEAPKFWEQSAARCFEATKKALDLMWLCKQQGASVEAPFTSFVLFTVVCTIMWCGFFPYMDIEHFVCSGKDQPDVIENFDKAAALLHSMQVRLTMANTWGKISREYIPVLIEARKRWKGTVGSPSSGPPASNDNPGLDLYKPLEMKLKSFGPEPDDGTANLESSMNLTDILRALEDSLKRTADGTKSEIKSEDIMTVDGTTESDSVPRRRSTSSSGFKAINAQNGETYGPLTSNPSHMPSAQSHHVLQPPAVPTHGLSSYRETLTPTAEAMQHFAAPTLSSYGSVNQEGVTTRFMDGLPKYTDATHHADSAYPAPENVDRFNTYYQNFNWAAITDSSNQVFVGNDLIPVPYHEFYGMHGYFHGAQNS